MKTFLSLFVFCGILVAQSVGTVVETTLKTVTATAGPLVCVYTNPLSPEFNMTCRVNGVLKMTQNATPSVGAGGIVGSFVEGQENVTWIVRQPTAGTVTYEIASNGVMRTGSF